MDDLIVVSGGLLVFLVLVFQRGGKNGPFLAQQNTVFPNLYRKSRGY